MHGVVTTLKGVLGRAIWAIHESRDNEIDRHCAVVLSQSGGRITDDIEREILREIFRKSQALAPEPRDVSACYRA